MAAGMIARVPLKKKVERGHEMGRRIGRTADPNANWTDAGQAADQNGQKSDKCAIRLVGLLELLLGWSQWART